ncbi:HAD family phosphatase [Citromicrobium bathyomarinum]
MTQRATPIRNVVFDVGNVIVRWEPQTIVELAFGHDLPAGITSQELFGGDIFRALNRGAMSLTETQRMFGERHGFDRKTCDRLVSALFESLHLIEETPPLMRRLKASGYGIYAITDNVHEIVAYLRGRYDFWPLFDGACVSADHSTLKPDPRMYTWLTETYGLVPEECVFFDDLQKNVDGAKAVGMESFVFTTTAQAEADLRSIGVDPDAQLEAA